MSWTISADEARHIFNEAASKGGISVYGDLTAVGEAMTGGVLSGVYWGTGPQFGVTLMNDGADGKCVSGLVIGKEQLPIVAIQIIGELATVLTVVPPVF